MDQKAFLDYNGLKKLVQCVLAEMPKADGTTIKQNADGTFSAQTGYIPTIDSGSDTLTFSSSPSYVDNSTETLVYNSFN